jgi:hypothetical protein
LVVTPALGTGQEYVGYLLIASAAFVLSIALFAGALVRDWRRRPDEGRWVSWPTMVLGLIALLCFYVVAAIDTSLVPLPFSL